MAPNNSVPTVKLSTIPIPKHVVSTPKRFTDGNEIRNQSDNKISHDKSGINKKSITGDRLRKIPRIVASSIKISAFARSCKEF